MQTRFFRHYLVFGLALTVLLACSGKEEAVSTSDPVNLSVSILSVDQQTGKVVLQAAAQNAVEYQFFLSSETEPHEVNTTGYFEYICPEEGIYQFNVRAYGSSGKYIQKSSQVTYSPGGDPEPVPLDKGYSTPLEFSGYDLVWNDEFSGTTLNTQNWGFDIGDGCPGNCGWGNNELEYYRSQNAWVANEVLTIEARAESFSGHSYTSAKLKSAGKEAFQYGRVDIRALLPVGQGLWPALWMLGDNIGTVGWPVCGEIDIMEMIGGNNRENQVHGTLHWNDNGHASSGNPFTLSSGTFATEYHVFTLIWDSSYLRWYVNDQLYHTINISVPGLEAFHQPFWFILNVAVGGSWPGNPDASTIFPQQMKVDYIRVFQKSSLSNRL